MHLNDCLPARHGKVMRERRRRDEAACRERPNVLRVHRIAHPDQETAGDHGDVLVGGVEMGSDHIALPAAGMEPEAGLSERWGQDSA